MTVTSANPSTTFSTPTTIILGMLAYAFAVLDIGIDLIFGRVDLADRH